MRTNVKSRDFQNFIEDLNGYYQDQEKKEDNKSVGERLKHIREMQGLTLDRLSKISGIDEGYLADVESFKVYPDLGTIIRLSKALKISTGFILDAASGYSYSVVRRDDRQKIKRALSGKKDRPDYEYQSLSTGVSSRHIESFIVTLAGKEYDQEPSTHDGEEFLYVLEGELSIRLGNKEESLKAGDSIFYLSTVPHALRSAGQAPAVLLAVVYTG